MARPISKIVRVQPTAGERRQRDRAQLLDQILEHKDAVEKGLDLLESVHKSGLLDFLQGIVEARNEIGEILVKLLDTPENLHGVKNLTTLLMMFGQFEPAELDEWIRGLERGMKAARQEMMRPDSNKPYGVLGLLGLLKDPAVARGLRGLSAFLRGLDQTVHPTETP